MSQEEKKFLIPVAASTNPNDLGNLVREALQKKYSVTISAGSAGSIALAAVEQAKEGKEIKEVEIRLGPSWFGFTIKGEKTSSFKKIIAREGLIVLSCIILTGAVLLIPDIIVLKDTKQPIDLLTQKEHTLKDEEKKIVYKVIINKDEDFLKKFNTEAKIDEFIKKGGAVRRIELDISSFKGNFLIFVILLYPFYLIIRFILWAVRTLKQKE